MGKLFGTDGIRGVANQYPITCEIALKTGRAMGVFTRDHGCKTVIIGKDTRISGDMLESAIAAGVSSTGIDVLLAGVIPTPGVACLCKEIKDAGTGIVISASHNPYRDNGIKLFRMGGEKLSDEQEIQIENMILNSEIVPEESIGRISRIPDSLERYADFLLAGFPFRKLERRLKIIVDCSNGAASKVGRMIFNPSLFDVQFIHDSPDGRNINDHCGSQYTQELQSLVVEKKADLGLALDGDADRLIAIDETGCTITGDTVIAICARFAKAENRLKNNIVVSTIMSNIGLTQALDDLGIRHLKSDVGDRKVLAEMKQSGAVIGGEDSGHMIFLDSHTTGDGLLSALKLIEVMLSTGESLSGLATVMTVYPQLLRNVAVDASRPDFMKFKTIADTIKKVEKELGERGRVLIRYSGTQPLLRVMVEGPDQNLIETCCRQICECIKTEI